MNIIALHSCNSKDVAKDIFISVHRFPIEGPTTETSYSLQHGNNYTSPVVRENCLYSVNHVSNKR